MSRLCQRRGLSLIEMMVTIVIVALGIAGVITMFLYGYQSQLNAHYSMLATAAASEKLDEMRSAGFNGLDPAVFPSPFAVPELPAGMGTITTEPFPLPTTDNLVRITVAVEWEGGRGIQGNTRISTLLALHP
ncbi:MAG: prepilin-type N-terminal cleavage/methylation domain-containing protein [Armatimonadota bacterium]